MRLWELGVRVKNKKTKGGTNNNEIKMGCGSSRGPETEQDIQAKKTSNAIEQEIKADKNKMKHQVKLLLLGSGEAGKSTFAKQMKILYMDGFAQQVFRIIT